MKSALNTVFSVLFVYTCCFAQSKDSLNSKLDLLRAPSSPAASLLGFATSDIEKPSDVSSFMLSLQSATSNFSKLPSNYAVDLAPYWLLRSGNFTTDKLNSQVFNDIFKQTFVVSLGYKDPDSTEKNLNKNSSYVSLGLKFFILRGHYDANTQNVLNKIGELQAKIVDLYHNATLDFEKHDTIYIRLKQERDALAKRYGANASAQEDYVKATAALGARQKSLLNSKKATLQSLTEYNNDLKELQSSASKFKINRLGFFVDFAGGVSLEFINKTFNNSKAYNVGAWATFGNDWESGLGVFGIVRYLYNPKKIYADDNNQIKQADLSTFDAGGRIMYSNPENRFSFSVESIYRSVLNKNVIDPSWRLVSNFEYDLPNNQKVTLSFGRNFDGTITKQEGNLIAALTYLTGFGNKR